MDELLRGAGLMEAWQSELQDLLANLSSTARQSNSSSASQRRKLFFQLQNCIDVCHETNRVSYVSLSNYCSCYYCKTEQKPLASGVAKGGQADKGGHASNGN